VRRNTLAEVAVCGLLDAVLTGDDFQTAFVQQCRQPLDHKKQVALHQADGNRCDDSGKGTDAAGLRKCLFMAAFLLLRLTLLVARLVLLLCVIDGAIRLHPHFMYFALLAALGSAGLGGVLACLVLRSDGLFLRARLLLPDGNVLVARQRRTAFLLLAVGGADLQDLRFDGDSLGDVCVHLAW
jgi:hypothetical protein